MASSRRTYDTDVITLRTVFAKNPANSNIPALRVLTADGQGGTYWAVPSSLGANPAFNQIVTTAGTYTADLSFNTFRLLAGENMGMANGPPGSNATYLYAKAFSEIDISGENSLYAFRSNVLDSSLSLAGQNGITLRGDPATNTLFIVGPSSNAYTLSTGIYGFNQIKVTEAASTITSSVNGWDGTYLTATSPSTLLRYIGVNDIQLSTNVTTNSIFFTISTFTSKGYLDISANAYSAYSNSISTVSSLYTPLDSFYSSLSIYSSFTGFAFSSVVSSIDALAMSTGANFYLLTGLINARVTIDQFNDTIDDVYMDMYSTTVGLGTLGYLSTSPGGSLIETQQLKSTVQGLGTAGYISSAASGDVTKADLVSTVQGLGSSGYVSSLSAITVSTMFNSGSLSTKSLEVYGPVGLTTSGSTILRGPVYVAGPVFFESTVSGTSVSSSNLTSTVTGLGSSRYVSTSQLTSTVRGLGSSGYLSSTQFFSLSTGNVFTSSLNLLDVYTSVVNFVTISSGSLLVNGAKVSGGGGGGNVAQLVAGCNIAVSPLGGTGVVTVTNTGPTQADIDNSISSFSTALVFPQYNFSTVSTSYGTTFVTSNLILSTMNTATIAPSSSNLWVAVGYGATVPNSIQYSGNGTNWSNSTAGGFSLVGKGVAYNGSLWVAVGNNGGAAGSIQFSGDGINWSNATSGGFSSGGSSVAWNGSKWIAVGNNGGAALTSIQTSTDGKTWSGIASGGFSTQGLGIAWNGTYWVAVGQAGSLVGTLQYSVDGVNWSNATSGGFSAGGRGIAWNGSLWVAVGDDVTRPASIQYSGDGRNWSNAVTGGFISAGTKVSWNGRVWIAVGDDNVSAKSIQYSVDGSNWSDASTGGFSGGGAGIAWNGLFWVATGTGPSAVASLQTSPDGLVWTNASSGGFATGGVGVAFSSNLVPAYSQQNLTILPQNIPLYLQSTNQLFAQPSSLLIDNTLLVDGYYRRVGINCNSPGVDLDVGGVARFQTVSTMALNLSSLNGANYPTILPSTVAGLGQTYVSTTGLTSTVAGLGQTYISTTGLTSTVAGLGQTYISTTGLTSTVAGLGQTYISTSGLTSTVAGLGQIYVSTPTTSSVQISAGRIFVSSLTANNLSSLSLTVSTINGIPFGLPGYPSTVSTSYARSFNTSSLTVSSISQVNIPPSGSNLWVAAGNGNGNDTLKSSPDGDTWTNSASGGFTYNGRKVAYNGSLWVAVGVDDTAAQSVKYSTDGKNWSNALSGGFYDLGTTECNGFSVAWNGHMWVAVGQSHNTTPNNTILFSLDGKNWSNCASGGFDAYGFDVAWNGFLWVAVGYDSNPANTIKVSTDGKNWTNATSGTFSSSGSGVAWNGRLWVAVGDDGTQNIKYSYDGYNWMNTPTDPFASAGRKVAWNGSLWVAVGWDNSTPANTIKYSTDGINWYNSVGAGFESSGGEGIAWNGHLWIAVGWHSSANSTVQTSVDGITWSPSVGSAFATLGYGIGFSSNLRIPYSQESLDILPQNIPLFLRSTNQIFTQPSSLVFNTTLTVDGVWNRVGINAPTPQVDLDVGGTGRFQEVSTQALYLSSLNGVDYPSILPSTVDGLGQLYMSTLSVQSSLSEAISSFSTAFGPGGVSPGNLTSTVEGLGQIYLSSPTSNSLSFSTGALTASSILTSSIYNTGGISTHSLAVFGPATLTNSGSTILQGPIYLGGSVTFASTIAGVTTVSTQALSLSSINGANFLTLFPSTVAGLGQLYVSTSWLNSTVAGLGQDYVSTSWLNSTVAGLGQTFVSTSWLNSTVAGLGQNYISTSGLTSTVAGLGQTYLSSPTTSTLAFSTGQLYASSMSFVNIPAPSSNLWVSLGLGDTLGNTIQYSGDGRNWSNSSSGGFSDQGDDVAYNGSLWVAVGADTTPNNTIQYSYDGKNWSNSSGSGFDVGGRAIAWNGSLWVAVGYDNTEDNTLKYSYDGITWFNSVGSGFTGFGFGGYGVAWNGSLWVAVGDDPNTPNNTIKYSYDGISWSNSLGSGFTATGLGVAWNGRLWVAVGEDATQNNTIKYSYDGITWSNSLGSGFTTNGTSVAWNGRMWVAVGTDSTQNNTIKYSYDGITWSNSLGSGFTAGSGWGVAWNGSFWVAVGTSVFGTPLESIKTSVDGITWTDSLSGGFSKGSPSFVCRGYGVGYSSNGKPAYNQKFFEIESQAIPIYWTSTNQLSFTQSTLIANNTLFIDTTNRVGINTSIPQTDLDVAGSGRFQTVSTFALNVSSINGTRPNNGASIQVSTAQLYASSMSFVNIAAPSSNLWVAAGANSNIYSTDGITWIGGPGSTTTGTPFVYYDGSRWYLGGTSPLLLTSSDGLTFTSIPVTNMTTTFAVGYNGGSYAGQTPLWILGGSGTTRMYYSYNGTSFLASPTNAFTTSCRGVVWNGRMWVAVGQGGTTIRYSGTGLAFSNATGTFAVVGYAVAWNGYMWVAAGAGANANIRYSYDGINWSLANNSFSGSAFGIAWNGIMWVAAGADGTSAATLKYSGDGINWSNSASGSFATTGRSVAWNGSLWVATGDTTSPTVKYSQDGSNWYNATGDIAAGTYGVAYSYTMQPAYAQSNFQIASQAIPISWNTYNQMEFTGSTIVLNNTLTTTQDGKVGIRNGLPTTELDVFGTGRFVTASTQSINVSSINGAAFTLTSFPSTVAGLGQTYLSSPTTSTLGFSTASLLTSSITFGTGNGWVTMGALQAVVVSTVQFNSALGYVSSLYCGSTNVLSLPFYTAHINGTALVSSLLVGQPATTFSSIGFRLAITHDSAVKPGTTTWTTTSDQRVKDNIVDADLDRCYSDVKSLRLRRFDWNPSFLGSWSGTDRRVLGFVAQEVSTIVPKSVTVQDAFGYPDFQFLNIDQLNMSLFGSVKKLIDTNEQLHSTVKGQALEFETLKGTTTYILSTLKGLQQQ